MLERLKLWRVTRHADQLAATGGFADSADLLSWMRLEGLDASVLGDRRHRARLDQSCGAAAARLR